MAHSHPETMDDRFSFLFKHGRTTKPRDSGINMSVDRLGLRYLEDILEIAEPWLDWYKLPRSELIFQPPSVIQSKLEILESHDVFTFTGGNFLEEALFQGEEDRFLETIRRTGIPGIEVSTTVVDVSLERKASIIETATDLGLRVPAEIGKKPHETDMTLSTEEVIEEMNTCLDAGAEIVIYESQEVEQAIPGERGEANEGSTENLTRITDEVGADSIMFELPIGGHYVPRQASAWFIENVGPDVNLGNIDPEKLLELEQQRRGIGPGSH